MKCPFFQVHLYYHRIRNHIESQFSMNTITLNRLKLLIDRSLGSQNALQ